MYYVIGHYITGVEIESINEKINYGSVILLLTPAGYAMKELSG